MSDVQSENAVAVSQPAGGSVIYRHRISTRIWHWTNALVLLVMLMSGLMIFNAHPQLYWGQYGANPDTPWLAIGSAGTHGYLRVGSLTLDTTGVLGAWQDPNGRTRQLAFPYWATIPSSYNLALSRLWHLTFAWSTGICAAILRRAVPSSPRATSSTRSSTTSR